MVSDSRVPNILLLHDDHRHRVSYARLIRDRGWQLTVASTNHVQEQIEAARPDLVIVLVDNAGSAGAELGCLIKRLDHMHSRPVIVVRSEPPVGIASALDCQDPGDDDKLRAAVGTVLRIAEAALLSSWRRRSMVWSAVRAVS